MDTRRVHPGFTRASIALAAVAALAAHAAAAELTSQNHEKLKAILAESPKADADGDGILSYAEYEAFVRSREAERLPAGHQRGLMSMVLPGGDLLIADFEEDDPAKLAAFGWKIEGRAFGKNASQTARLVRRRVGAISGRHLLTTLVEGDEQVGKLLSPPFELELPYIDFLLSGGEYPQRLCINLLIDGRVVRTATGRNDDRLERVAFDVSELKGRIAQVQIVDAERGVWGHINVDHVVQTVHSRARRTVSKPPRETGTVRAAMLTIDDRLEGPCTFADGSVVVDGEPVPLDALLLAVFTGQAGVESGPPHTVNLTNGECWVVDIVGVEGGKVTIKSKLLGDQQIPLSRIVSLVFQPGGDGGNQPGMLYRVEGDPIRGELVWIREKDIAIDCALGVVPLPRNTVRRYVVRGAGDANAAPDRSNQPPDSEAPPVDADELGLVDGSKLRGQLRRGDGGLSLVHAAAGAIPLTWESIRYVRRTPPRVRWLDMVRVSKTDSTGPVSPPPAPRIIAADRSDALRLVRMMPRTVARFAFDAAAAPPDGKRVFRAALRPMPGARAAVRVRITVGDETIWENTVAPDSAAIGVSVSLPAADGFAIEVDYAGPITFPAGVDWLDAHIYATPKGTSDS